MLDSALLRAVDSPAPGGLSFEELSALLRTLLDGPAVGVQITVFDPDLDPDGSQAQRADGLPRQRRDGSHLAILDGLSIRITT